MLDPETIQEIAKATGKTADVVKATGGFLGDVFGKTARLARGGWNACRLGPLSLLNCLTRILTGSL
jgi:hypothetical protein